MRKSERFSKIQMLLRQHGPMSLDQIKDELGVSSWTCFCDLSDLRDRFNLPIEMQRETGRYRWVETAFSPDSPTGLVAARRPSGTVLHQSQQAASLSRQPGF